MKIFTILFILFVHTANAVNIVAIVGSRVITDYDVKQRTKIIALLKNFDLKNQDLMNQIEKEMVGYLIEESIKKDYAEKAKIELKPEMLNIVLEDIAKQHNKKNIAALKSFLQQNDIDYTSFEEYIKDELSWNGMVKLAIMPSIKVEDFEIDEMAYKKQLDKKDPTVREQLKEEISQEKLLFNVRKILSQMRRFYHIEILQ